MSLDQAIGQAGELFKAGRSQDAQAVLQSAMRGAPAQPMAHQLLGLILHSQGDAAGAERELRTAITLEPQGELYSHTLARMLTSQKRHAEAAEVHAAFARRVPTHPLADFWRAQSLYSAGQEIAAAEAGRLAIAKGLNRAEAWLFLARLAMQGGRFDEGETAYRNAVRLNPADVEAQRELAQIVWMRTADVRQASAAIDAAGNEPGLLKVKVKLLQDTGDHAGAYRLAAEAAAADPRHDWLAARASLFVAPEEGIRHLARAAPDLIDALTALKVETELAMAVGDLDRAARSAARLRQAYPDDHYGLTLQLTLWRLIGDARYGEFYDYDRLVRPYSIEAPSGWSDLASYLADLQTALDGLHGLKTHPIGQSLRHGTQTHRSLLEIDHPAIKAFFTAIDAPIRRHIASLGEARQDYAIAGVWSVRLNREGFHTNHSHPEGWLSSAFYARLPKALDVGRQGWIKFGEPGVPTKPKLEAEHYVRPEPGMLVLFPSYMWHGTVPYQSDETRMTCAFDLVRAP